MTDLATDPKQGAAPAVATLAKQPVYRYAVRKSHLHVGPSQSHE